MSYQARVVADSIGPHGHRLTTMVVTFPRFILAEVNTHRMLSRNSASSRAIPTEKLIQRVVDDPFIPETFNRRVKGMGVGNEIIGDDAVASREAWLWAAQNSISAAIKLNELGIDKSRVNRLLEPFLWHTALISATEWLNFFALRDHPAAQPEFQIVARMMREAMETSTPKMLDYGQWHLPFVIKGERVDFVPGDRKDFWPLVSAGRCFVVSYDRLDDIEHEDQIKSFERADGGKDIGHWSPLEHPAVCCKPAIVPHDDWYGNFQGWRQLRKYYANEDDFSKVLAA